MEPIAHDRTAPRESVLLMASVAGEDGGAAGQHRVRNVSATGVCIDTAATLVVGDRHVVVVGYGEPVGATVRWVRGVLAGLHFDQPIDVAAARTRRIADNGTPRTGWMNNINDAYKSAGKGTGARPPARFAAR